MSGILEQFQLIVAQSVATATRQPRSIDDVRLHLAYGRQLRSRSARLLLGRLSSGLRRRWQARADARRRRRDCQVLLALSDHLLRDMGLRREAVRAALYRSVEPLAVQSSDAMATPAVIRTHAPAADAIRAAA